MRVNCTDYFDHQNSLYNLSNNFIMNFKGLSILALVALVVSLTATADPVDEHAAQIDNLKAHAEELDSRIQQVKAMEENLRRRHEELDQHALQLEAEHQNKMQELEALHEDKIKALGKELEFVEEPEHVKKTEKEAKEAEPEEDDDVHV